MVQGRSKTFRAPVTARITQVPMLLRRSGRVMKRTCCHLLPPSMVAASYSSDGIPDRPVSRITK